MSPLTLGSRDSATLENTRIPSNADGPGPGTDGDCQDRSSQGEMLLPLDSNELITVQARFKSRTLVHYMTLPMLGGPDAFPTERRYIPNVLHPEGLGRFVDY